jgi:heme/copper-type cytochrome/quinol oxidase subunit 2
VSSLFAHALRRPVNFMLSVHVILCDCVTCTCLSYCNIVALYNCYRVESHLQLKTIIIIIIIIIIVIVIIIIIIIIMLPYRKDRQCKQGMM